jgi:hypothetical protein
MVYLMEICSYSRLTKYYYVTQNNNNEMGRHVARMGDWKGAHIILVGKERRHLKDLGVDIRIILKWLLNRLEGPRRD